METNNRVKTVNKGELKKVFFFILERKGHDVDVEPAVEEAVGVTTKDHLDYKNDDNNVVISDDYEHQI